MTRRWIVPARADRARHVYVSPRIPVLIEEPAAIGPPARSLLGEVLFRPVSDALVTVGLRR